MLNKIEVYTPQGALLSLPLQDVTAGFVVKEIEGLDPVKANLVYSSFAQIDGSQYQASRRENRNLVIKLGLEPDYVNTTVSALRSQLYNFFMPKMFVTLRFYIDNIHFVSISGRVESCESPLFTDDPEVVVSLVCFDPNFVAPASVVVNGSTVAGTTEQSVIYPGSIETGMIFRLMVNRTVSQIMVYNRPLSGELMLFEFSAPLIAGDLLVISTVAGAKSAFLTRAGARNSILYGASPAANWINLFPGKNNLRVFAEGAAIPFSIEYTAKYGGL